MSKSWYYVDSAKNESIGPVSENTIRELIDGKSLTSESFIWSKGFDNWLKIKDVMEFSSFAPENSRVALPEIDPFYDDFSVDEDVRQVEWDQVDRDARIFHIKTGRDREEASGVEYGPFTLNEIIQLYRERRISGETFFYTQGMVAWEFLTDIPGFQNIFGEVPPAIDEQRKRKSIRKPFVARMFFHDLENFYEGVCRDISIGGMQILVSLPEARVGSTIQLNVHPDNTEFHFVASGKIVRILDGGQGFSIRFVNLTTDAKNAISSYLKKIDS